ncbi:HlyD family secretion protein [Bradyrhizobium sp. WD16]|uniref:HlyD family secretion protein n=1 Tax=Bradyrhizobium sp. WD16 TaxID=1521768 RepID=UPI0020A3B022|nr:HlyD family efflux transporter periplasmic adaptor subunit [Bradyrhizobium sp. WD16]UTD25523.1 multidrug transporter [Bradyrhizobium sp. WD16]
MALWNRRSVRITVGILLLGGAVVAILPTLTGYTSLDGTVNALITVISAPIDGTVTVTPPKIGTALTGGTELLGIRNDQIVRTAEVQMSAELEAARQRLQAMDARRTQLMALREELHTRWLEYQQASIQNLTQQIDIRRQQITTAMAQRVAAASDLTRKQRLGVTGIVAESVVEQARAASVGAENARTIADMELDRLTLQLDSVRKGIFIGEGRNDVPYSQQRIDEISIQLAELEFSERDLKARIVQLSTQQEEEHERNRTLGYVNLRIPFDGVVWRNNVVEGSHVIAGNELMQVLDCRDLFVDILVAEVDYDQIYPGREAQIRLFGRSDVLEGKVLSVRGSAAVVDDVVLAAKPPQSRGKDARIRVGLPQSALNSDYPNFCQVGRSVQVRFKTRSLPIVRWLRSIWFSIT